MSVICAFTNVIKQWKMIYFYLIFFPPITLFFCNIASTSRPLTCFRNFEGFFFSQYFAWFWIFVDNKISNASYALRTQSFTIKQIFCIHTLIELLQWSKLEKKRMLSSGVIHKTTKLTVFWKGYGGQIYLSYFPRKKTGLWLAD